MVCGSPFVLLLQAPQTLGTGLLLRTSPPLAIGRLQSNLYMLEFPSGLVVKGSGVVTAVARVAAVVQLPSLAQELLHSLAQPKKKKKKKTLKPEHAYLKDRIQLPLKAADFEGHHLCCSVNPHFRNKNTFCDKVLFTKQ